MNDLALKARDGWDVVSGLFKFVLMASVVIAFASNYLWQPIHAFLAEAGYLFELIGFRAWIYYFSMYFVVLPFLYVQFERALRGHVFPRHAAEKKLIVVVAAFALGVILVLAPFILMVQGVELAGKIGSLARLLRDSMIGLMFLGAITTCAAALGLWIVCVAVPRVWYR